MTRNIAPRPSRSNGALLPPDVLQPPVPPLSPGQHTPAPPPVSRQLKPLGHVLAIGLQLETQYLLPAPSSPQLPDAQSVLLVHGEPRPPCRARAGDADAVVADLVRIGAIRVVHAAAAVGDIDGRHRGVAFDIGADDHDRVAAHGSASRRGPADNGVAVFTPSDVPSSFASALATLDHR